MSDVTRMDRREFVKVLGGGILVCVNVGSLAGVSACDAQGFQRTYPEDINAYLHIPEEGKITLRHIQSGRLNDNGDIAGHSRSVGNALRDLHIGQHLRLIQPEM